MIFSKTDLKTIQTEEAAGSSSPSSSQFQNFGDLARSFVKPLRKKFYLKNIIPYKWNSIFKDEEESQKEMLKVEMLIERRASENLNQSDCSKFENSNIDKNKEMDTVSLYDEICSELNQTLIRNSALSTLPKTDQSKIEGMKLLDDVEVDTTAEQFFKSRLSETQLYLNRSCKLSDEIKHESRDQDQDMNLSNNTIR